MMNEENIIESLTDHILELEKSSKKDNKKKISNVDNILKFLNSLMDGKSNED